MVGGLYDSSLTRARPFFAALFARDASGRGWLPKLLAASPNGRSALGDLVDAPGSLLESLAVEGASGHLACFEYPVAPPRELLIWFIENPDELVWPPRRELSKETVRLRRALLRDDPSGSRAGAQERARELIEKRSPFSPEWWRFEGVTQLDCVLMTDRLVITVEGKRNEPLSPATDWYPRRSQLVRNLEAAKQLANGRRWASLLLSEQPLAEGSDEHLEETLTVSAPHLKPIECNELHAAYLGNLTWEAACRAIELPFASLPDTREDRP